MFLFRSSKKDTLWWLEIETQTPKCTYYFGPFDSAKEARHHRAGYVDDLRNEQAVGLVTKIKRWQTETLTIFDEEKLTLKPHL
ncbi:hypothetical protein C1752_08703 [Acaryochloris thomasi RCC1774]|uniref:DUF1816 domain-containing protein n=1 Tax=Acaryochloris thomasi RCC1774 TaxID=1764569 RepID=A0A2W1JA86_9CYAN|nr:DUF1816 domain-containing protein [Acaryochloris thomasi]PZD70928.1 hypothetical protein C1752_08703 [Acaryochloris thomasi RCC1774]